MEKFGIIPSQQRLFYNNRELIEHDATIGSLHLAQKSTIILQENLKADSKVFIHFPQ